MKGTIFQKTVLLLLLFISFPLASLNSEEMTETERQKLIAAEHEKTGIEPYIFYPVPLFIPGLFYDTKKIKTGESSFSIPAVNISFINICVGLDMDFGSSKRVLKNMGVGTALEWNIMDSYNMGDNELTLFQFYNYLYYFEDTKRFMDYYFKAGIGIATISNRDIFETEEEKNSPTGPMMVVEMGSRYPDLGRFRFSSGFTYKYIPINTRYIHVLAPFVRVGYRL